MEEKGVYSLEEAERTDVDDRIEKAGRKKRSQEQRGAGKLLQSRSKNSGQGPMREKKRKLKLGGTSTGWTG